MKIGIMHIQPDSAADPAVVARRAEELGFESYWVADHTILPVESSATYPGVVAGVPAPDYLWQIPDPLIVLARVSGATTTIKLGTGICLVPERNPLLLAKQIASLDDASGGRVLFGIGAGWNPEECGILGGDFEHRWSQVKDHVAAMKVLWTEDISEYHGRYVDFPPVRCFPKPARKPHPPILLGSVNNTRAFRRIAQWGDGWLPLVNNVEEFASGVAEILELARAEGRSPAEFDFTAFGLDGQWRTKADIAAVERAGAGRVVIWLREMKLAGILRELEDIAKTVLN
ncbi:MAG: LLM class F420-dependent oxidoreductase [Porticoccaceae bacterium]